LLGVRRDLFNKLAGHRWAQDDDLQQRYGIIKGDLFFKDYFLFKQKRAQKSKPKPEPKSKPIVQAYGNDYIFKY
jgi:hypothetical protein